MTTGWLLLLVVTVSSQSVDSQSTTDDETCHGELSDLRTDVRTLLRQFQTLTSRLGKS